MRMKTHHSAGKNDYGWQLQTYGGRDEAYSAVVIFDLGPVHTTPFLYKSGEKNLRFCESVHTDPHKNATKRVNGGFRKRSQTWISTKTEVFENAFDQCERTKSELFENAPISNNELHKNGVM